MDGGSGGHVERCFDDKVETSQMQQERIQEQRRRGDGLEAWTGRKIEIPVDKFLRGCGKMMKNKANAPSECLVTENITGTSHEIRV